MIILPILVMLTQGPAPATRTLTVDDLFRIQRVSNPQVSPDGQWVAYVIASPDLAADKSTSRIWMVATAGGDPIPLTAKGSSASSPRWSPDGKYLGFLATRGEDAESQVWLLNRLGGEAEQLTSIKQGVNSFVWSPNGARLALEVDDPTPDQAGDTTWIGAKAKTQRPYVIDRLQFKRDGTGGGVHAHQDMVTLVLENAVDALPIRRPADGADVAVERCCERPRPSTLHADDSEVARVVDDRDRHRRGLARVDERPAVGAPGGIAVRPRLRGDATGRRALGCVVARDHPHIRVVVAVDAVAVAGERDQASIGGPGGPLVVPIA